MRCVRPVTAALVLVAAPALAAAQVAPGAERPFGPLALTPRMVACTDLPVATPPTSSLHVLAAHTPDSRSAYAAGETLVLDGGTGTGLDVGQRFYVRRLQRPLRSAGPGRDSITVRTTGWVTITAVDDETALAVIDVACAPIEPGDFLEPYTAPVLPVAPGPDGPPQFDRMARVLSGTDRRLAFATGDLFALDRGADAGLVPGARLVFFRDRQNGTPLVPVGEGVVVSVSSAGATAVLTKIETAVEVGDYAAPRGPRER